MLGNMEKAPVEIDAKPDASPKPSHQEDEPKTDYSSKATNKTSFSDYLASLPTPGIGLYTDEWQRIFTYSTLSDRIFLVLAALAEVGTGVTLPLMNIIFGKSLLVQVSTDALLMFLGRLVGSFSTYTNPNSPDAKAKFFHNLNQQTLVVPQPQFLNSFQQYAFGKCLVPFLATNSSLKISLLRFPAHGLSKVAASSSSTFSLHDVL
jgi:ATP-binding cassette subfamily B (MDR/TAP) protein 1